MLLRIFLLRLDMSMSIKGVRKRARMIVYFRIFSRKARREMSGNISRAENLKRGTSYRVFFINDSYEPVPQIVEKPTEVEYKPIPAFDRKYINALVCINFRKRRTFKTPANGEFYRSRSKRRILANEELSETEDDVTEDWLMIKHEEVHNPYHIHQLTKRH